MLSFLDRKLEELIDNNEMRAIAARSRSIGNKDSAFLRALPEEFEQVLQKLDIKHAPEIRISTYAPKGGFSPNAASFYVEKDVLYLHMPEFEEKFRYDPETALFAVMEAFFRGEMQRKEHAGKFQEAINDDVRDMNQLNLEAVPFQLAAFACGEETAKSYMTQLARYKNTLAETGGAAEQRLFRLNAEDIYFSPDERINLINDMREEASQARLKKNMKDIAGARNASPGPTITMAF